MSSPLRLGINIDHVVSFTFALGSALAAAGGLLYALNWSTPLLLLYFTLRRHLQGEGVSFQDLLIDVRMSHALALLQVTDLPIGQIALEVGYDSASRFAVRFRRRFAMSPSEVRGASKAPG